jgi:PAS domain S-box-containing protein
MGEEAPCDSDRLALTAIVDGLSDPVFGKGLDGTIRSWNAGAEHLYGYRADEIVGRPVGLLAPPGRAAEIASILERLRRGEAIEEFDTVRRRKDGTEVQVALSISPVRNPAGTIVGAATIAHDIGERKRREELYRFLAEASRLLALEVDVRETLSRVASLTLTGLADCCLVELADDGALSEVALAQREPAQAALLRALRLRYPPSAERPNVPLRVLATGKPELIPAVSDALLRDVAQDDEHLRLLRQLGFRSLLVVPLRARERTLGTILLANAASPRQFDAQDLELVEDLAGRAALAVENADLHRSEQAARRKAERTATRIGRLQAFTAALSRASTASAVTETLVRQGAAAVGADGAFLRLLSADATALELVATAGSSRPPERAPDALPVTSPLPAAEAFRTGEPRYLTQIDRATGEEALAFVPLDGQHGPIGVMALSFARLHRFEDEERELLETLARQGALALERAHLYEAERDAHAAAEQAVARTARLQSLAADLAEALTPAEVARVAVAQGIASIGADAGALQLVADGGGTLEIAAGQGTDSSLLESFQRFPSDLRLPSTDALRSGEPVFVESEDDIRARYPAAVGPPLGLRARAGAHIPLVVSGQPLGVLFLGFGSPRRFSDSQRSFMLALGRQCAQALKRAQLYEAEVEGRRLLDRLVEGLHEGVVSVNRDGLVEFANSTATRMLGPALASGRPLPELWLGFPLHGFAAELFDGGQRVAEAQIRSQDGDRAYDLAGVPAVGSDTVLLVITDVVERERRGRAEREFVANAAHELRTPLASITSAIERLQAGARDVPEKRDRYLGHIQSESARLNRLAASLLVLARAQTREEQPRLEDIALPELLDELVDGLELRPGVELTVDCPRDLVVRTNRDLLEHALVNLVGNAARHTERGRIDVTARVGDDGSVTATVADTGCGIAAEELGRLFERFYRGPREEARAGFGLGLPITKDAVEAIGGRVEIESTLGAGTTARILLPTGARVPA